MSVSAAVSGSQNGSGGTRTVTLGSAPISGDLIVAMMGHGGAKAALSITTQSGWTTLIDRETGGTIHATKIVAKISDGTEGTTYTTGTMTSGSYLDVVVLRSTIGWPAIGSIIDQTATATATATELTATPSALSQTSTVGLSCIRGTTSQSADQSYWDGGTGAVPHHRSTNGCADYKINTAIPGTASARYATYSSGAATLSAVWVKESTAAAIWPAGTADDLYDVVSTDDMAATTPREVVEKFHTAIRAMITEVGANPSGTYPTVAERLDDILPATGGTFSGDVTASVVLDSNGSSALHAASKQQVDAAIPASEVSSPAAGHALVYNSTTQKWGNVLSPWSAVAQLPATPLISDFQEVAPYNVRGVEYMPLYDTDITAFDAPSGTLMYVDAVNGIDTNAGTTGAPKKTLTAAINAINAGATNTKLIVRTGHYRESIPVINTASKVLGIQAARAAKVWLKGSDVMSGWTYEPANTRWVWNGTFNPPLVSTNMFAGFTTHQVHIDAVPQLQAASGTALAAGSFYVDTVAQRLYIGQAAGWNQNAHIVEATRRGYVWGTNTASGSKAGFFFRGIGVAHWGSDDANAVYAAMTFRGSTQIIEYCVFAHNSCVAYDTSNAVNLTSNQIVEVNNGAVGWHSNNDSGTVSTKRRCYATNWEQKFDATPGSLAHFGGCKITGNQNFTGDEWLVRNGHCNGIWFDVNTRNIQLTRISSCDNWGFGFTCELGDQMKIGNAYFARNGNALNFSRDGYRISGQGNSELYNITSSDNVGAAFEIAEDWRTYSANLAQPTGIGETFNTRYANNINLGTARATRNLLYTLNGKAGGSQAHQVPAFTAEQMFATDPWVAAASQVMNDHHNLWIRLANKPVATWAQPTSDFNGTGWGASTTLTLAQMQTKGGTTKCEVGSLLIDDFGAAVSKYLPGGDDPSIWAYTTIPGDALNRSTLAAIPPNWVCAALGIANGTQAKYGCNDLIPVPVQT